MRTTSFGKGLGWWPDMPSHRDRTAEHPSVKPLLEKVGLTFASAPNNKLRTETMAAELPKSVDLRAQFSPIDDQGSLGACQVHAAVGLVEYFELNTYRTFNHVSRRFLYKVARDLDNTTGDVGASCSTAMLALKLFGGAPEQYWPWTEGPEFDLEPPAFLYAFAGNYKAMKYYRLDPPSVTPGDLLNAIKTNLANKLPSMFGMPWFPSCDQSYKNGGKIPYPSPNENTNDGHCMDVVGYDDDKMITNNVSAESTTGAFIVRNSWGEDLWGEKGYGWLPYKYVIEGLAIDWWSIIEAEWIDLGPFGQ